MEQQHSCVVIQPRETDYIKGVNSPIPFKAVTDGNWESHNQFFERQKFDWDNDGCVLFAGQEDFDAQVDRQIQSGEMDVATLEYLNQMGFMDTNSRDGKAHFHSSPRFLQVLTRNGQNGNPMTAPGDVMRKYGILPWTDLPFDGTMTIDEYFAPIPQNLLDKAASILATLRGKDNLLQYHWVNNGGPTDTAAMDKARQQAPLLIAIFAQAPSWNAVQPAIPEPTLIGNHAIENYNSDANGEWCLDHYDPFEKQLLNGYPIHYVMQIIVSPLSVLPSMPTTIAPTQKNVDILKQIVALYQKLLSLIKPKVGTSSQQMNSKLSTVWTFTKHATATAIILFLPFAYHLAMNKWGDITIGAVLTFAYAWLCNKFGIASQPVAGDIAPIQPPSGQDIMNAVYRVANAIANFVSNNPLVAVFLLAGIAVLAYMPPVAVLILIVVGLAYLLHK